MFIQYVWSSSVMKESMPKTVVVSITMIRDEQDSDYFKLFLVVRENGGYDAVSRNGLWDRVAKESGLGSSMAASAVKVVYIRYLNVLEKWLDKFVENKDSIYNRNGSDTNFSENMELEADVEHLKENNVLHQHTKLVQKLNFCDRDDLDFREEGDVTEDEAERSVQFSNGCRPCGDYDSDNKKEVILGMINWITQIAMNPCDSVIGLLPERSKWKSCGNEEVWKQVLLFREAMLVKRHINSSAVQFASQKIHPCMFDDSLHSSYNLRGKLKSAKVHSYGKSSPHALSEMRSSPNLMVRMEDQLNQEMLLTTDSCMPGYMPKYASKHVPLGPTFQVEVPDWSSTESESDAKWLGTLDWPFDEVNWISVIEHDLIGKGRQDSCECHMLGSITCIRRHISEKRVKVKMELGSAFDIWKFDRMGEEVTVCWTKKEKRNFKKAVRSSFSSFWTRIAEIFSSRSREDIVCYYFNVFLLQRRGFQNRFAPDNINSDDDDDDEMEFELENT